METISHDISWKQEGEKMNQLNIFATFTDYFIWITKNQKGFLLQESRVPPTNTVISKRDACENKAKSTITDLTPLFSAGIFNYLGIRYEGDWYARERCYISIPETWDINQGFAWDHSNHKVRSKVRQGEDCQAGKRDCGDNKLLWM